MANYIVTTISDSGADATSAGSLSADQSDGGGLSLREALTLANSTGVADTISFDASLNGSTIVLTNGELQISSDITLDGDVDGDDRADITLDGNGTSRVLHVFNSGTDALLQSLRITNGSAFYGGGIYLRRATLTVEDSTIDGNFANIHGGAISAKLAGPTLNLLNTNISNNTTNNGGGGVHGQFATINAVNTTIVGNSAPSNGGAIRAESSTVTLTNSTLTGNSANLGSAVYGINSPIDLINTIALGNYDTFSSPSIEPQFRAVSGSTLTQTDSVTTGDATTVFAATTTVGTATAGVAGYYGGSVETIALLQDASNPALDIGTAPAGLTTDTLGNDRDVDLAGVANGGTVDAGAVELTGLPETASLIVTIIDDIVDQFDGETSLREAINFVNTGILTGTITFASGTGEAFENDATIALTGGELSLIAAVIIDGDHDSDGVADVTIDAQDSSRVFSVSTTGAEISGLNITNGYTSGGDNGAGIYVASGAELTLSNSMVTNSDATGGTSPLTGIGGGIGNFGTLTVENSQISGNSARNGAGIGQDSATLVVTNSTISGNDGIGAVSYGGAISSRNPGGTVTVYSSTLSGNTAGFNGGGLYMQSGTLTVANSTVSGNSAGYEGGGIRSAAAADVNVTNTTLSGNYAQFVGGHHAGTKGGLTNLANVVFLGNADADNSGSELYSSGTLNFNGQNIVGSSTTEFNASVSANVDNASASTVFGATVSSNGVDAGVLADNGGVVETIALAAGAGNPAVNSGDASQINEATVGRDLNGDGDTADTIATDANGIARSQDGALDLGAVEFVPVPEAASLIVTTATDVVDQFDNETSLREAIGHVNDGTLSGTITFESSLAFATFFLYGGALSITGDVNIDGDANGDGQRDIILDGLSSHRVFEITSGTSVLENLFIQSGSAANGGALNISGVGTAVTLDSSIVDASSATGAGGGIFQDTDTSLVITESSLSQNAAGTGGGGLYSRGDLTIVNSSIANNSVSGGTGGAGVLTAGTSSITNTTFTGNSANGSLLLGGAIFNAGDLSLTNSTLSGNSAFYGGGFYQNSTATLTNSIVLGNTSQTGGETRGYGATTLVAGNIIGTNVYSGAVDVGDTTASDVFQYVNGGAGQANYNGGPFATIALRADAANPALDVGTAPAGIATDATGSARDVDLVVVDNGGTVDAGAVELQVQPEAPSLVVTISSDTVDALDNETSLREAIGHVNDGALTGTITFAAALAGQTFTLAGTALGIDGNVTISGDADGDGTRDIIVDANAQSRVFDVISGTSELIDLTVQNGQSTGNGGAIQLTGTGSALTLTDSLVQNSSTTASGGGIATAAGTSITLTRSELNGNSASSNGGGIDADGALTVLDSLLTSNTAGQDGAGAAVASTATFTNTTFEGNDATVDGGAIHGSGATITLTHVTATGNSAGGLAGGIQTDGGSLTFNNTIVLGNTQSAGQQVSAVNTVFGFNNPLLVGNVADVFEAVDATTGGGLLADNGGPVRTVALLSDAANPALDSGTAVPGVATDANGAPRDVDLAGVANGGTVDTGAVEVQLLPETASLIVTTLSDTVDVFDGETSLREAIGHVNDGTLSGTITFAGGTGEAFETGGTITLGGTQLTLTSSITIDGDADGDGASDVTVDANDLSRVFSASAGTSRFEALTVTGGDNSTFGGGVYVATGASLTLDRSIVQDNAATSGAGLFNNGGTLTLIDSLVTDNSTNGGNGGGIFSTSNGLTTLTNTTFEGNTASSNGGAIFGQSSTIELVNVTATGNTAGNQGGATFTNAGSLGLTNTLVIGNSQSSGQSVSAINTVLDIDNVLLVGNAADIFAAVDLGTGGGLLADNGGPVQTVALLEDVANLAADAGNSTLLVEATIGFDLNGDGDTLDTIATDANGDARVIGDQVDLGAVEIQAILGSVAGDTLTGSANADTFVTGAGVDVVIAGDGDDSVDGGSGADAVDGGSGNDSIDGGTGDDLLVGGAGGDLLYGGDDDDQLAPGADADTVFGGDGEDTVSYADSTSPLSVDLSDDSNNAGDAAGDQISEVENLVGSSTAANTLTGDVNANTIEGGAADDTINGGGGNDRLEGNGGADTLDGGLGDDTIVVDSADDVTDQAPGEGYDRVLATASVMLGDHVEAGNLLGTDDLSMTASTTGSWLNGNAGNNTLTGQGGADRLDGNAGNDVIDGAGGNDLLEGGSGADTFVLSDGIDVILDFEDGVDLIDLTGFGLLFSDLSVSQSGTNVSLGHAAGTMVINNLDVTDLSAADFIEPAASAPPVVTGTGGNDNLFESAGPIEIRGLGGNDLLGVFNGAATLVGGEGNDQYYVYDAATAITELAGEGTDLVRSQVDLVLADNVENAAVLGAGDVALTGNGLGNFLTGSAGTNVLSGEAGNDRLLGLAGADTLDGGLGNDILQGGPSDGASDVFVFETGDGNDLVIDFELDLDVIDLSATGLAFGDLTISGATNAQIDTGTDLITVNGVSAAQLDSDQFSFAP